MCEGGGEKEDGRGGRARRKEGEEGREMAGEEDGRRGRKGRRKDGRRGGWERGKGEEEQQCSICSHDIENDAHAPTVYSLPVSSHSCSLEYLWCKVAGSATQCLHQ